MFINSLGDVIAWILIIFVALIMLHSWLFEQEDKDGNDNNEANSDGVREPQHKES